MDDVIRCIQEEFKNDIHVKYCEFKARRSTERIVKLEGVANSFYHKQIAQTIAQKIIDSCGNGFAVNNQIKVVYKHENQGTVEV